MKAFIEHWLLPAWTIAMVGVLWGILHTAYMLRRNRAVYAFRMRVLEREGVRAFEALASYEEMMRRWWVTDLDQFRS